MKVRAVKALGLLLLADLTSPSQVMAQVGDGYVGLYKHPSGYGPCALVDAQTSETLYVVAKLSGATTNGLTGAEFRVEVSNPDGWLFFYTPPANATVNMGDPIDRDPAVFDDGAGISLAFAGCQTAHPVTGGVLLGTITAFNDGGGPTLLLVKQHSTPTNANYPCPLFTLCDAPAYTKSCLTPNLEPPCIDVGVPPLPTKSTNDPAYFAAALNGATLQNLEHAGYNFHISSNDWEFAECTIDDVKPDQVSIAVLAYASLHIGDDKRSIQAGWVVDQEDPDPRNYWELRNECNSSVTTPGGIVRTTKTSGATRYVVGKDGNSVKIRIDGQTPSWPTGISTGWGHYAPLGHAQFSAEMKDSPNDWVPGLENAECFFTGIELKAEHASSSCTVPLDGHDATAFCFIDQTNVFAPDHGGVAYQSASSFKVWDKDNR